MAEYSIRLMVVLFIVVVFAVVTILLLTGWAGDVREMWQGFTGFFRQSLTASP